MTLSVYGGRSHWFHNRPSCMDQWRKIRAGLAVGDDNTGPGGSGGIHTGDTKRGGTCTKHLIYT